MSSRKHDPGFWIAVATLYGDGSDRVIGTGIPPVHMNLKGRARANKESHLGEQPPRIEVVVLVDLFVNAPNNVGNPTLHARRVILGYYS